MGGLLSKYSGNNTTTAQTDTMRSRLVNKYTTTTNNVNTLPSLMKENTNYQTRISSVGEASPTSESSTNPLMSALKFLSRFGFAGTNALKEFVDDTGSTPDTFDPANAWVRGFKLEETPFMKDSFKKLGVSDKSYFRKQIGPVDLNINAAGTLGLITEILNPLDPLSWLGGFGIEKGAAKGLMGTGALTKAFGEEAATKIASTLGEEAISNLGAKTVGDLTGKVSDMALNLAQKGSLATQNIDDVITLMKQGVIDTGNLANTKLPYNTSKRLTQKISPPLTSKVLAEIPIPGTQPLAKAASALGDKITDTKLGDWFARNFSTKYTPKNVPNRLGIKNLGAIKELEQMMDDLIKNPGPETNMTLDTLRSIKDEIEKYQLPKTNNVNVPTWVTDTDEWLHGTNPINDILKPYIERNGIQDGLAEAAQTTLNTDKRQVAPMFYSKLGELVGNKMSNSMPVDQFIKFLNSNQIKPEEMKWMDIEGLVEGKTKVTKQEVKDWLDNHDLGLQEVTKGTPTKLADEARDTDWYRELTSKYGVDETERMVIEYHNDKLSDKEMLNFLKGANLGRDDLDDILIAPMDASLPTRYEGYKEPGGKDYQEMLITMPQKRNNPALQWQEVEPNVWESDRFQISPFVGDTRLFPEGMFKITDKTTGNTIDTLRDLDEAKSVAQAYIDNRTPGTFTEPYRSGHWDEKNILAHVRFDTREVDGKKILFIQEVQSDWHQAGRKDGYINPKSITVTQEALDDATIAAQRMIRRNDYLGFDTVSQALSALRREPDVWDLSPEDLAIANTYREAFEGRAKKGKGVPDAPFQKTWPEMVMKRMTRYAAENGYDGIAWTTGKQQAERYGLSKAVDRLEYDTSSHNLMGYKDGLTVIDKPVSPDELPNYVGQEYATKLLDTTAKEFKVVPVHRSPNEKELERLKAAGLSHEEAAATSRTVYQVQDQFGNVYREWDRESTANTMLRNADDNLKTKNSVKVDTEVGGKGMRGFYDEMLPKTMDKYIKKWGSKVERQDIPMSDVTEMVHNMDEYSFYDNIAGRLEDEGKLTTHNMMIELENSFENLEENLADEGIYEKIAFTPEEARKFAENYVQTANEILDGEDLALKQFTDDKMINTLTNYLVEYYPRNPNVKMSSQHYFPVTDAMKEEVMYKGQPLFRKSGREGGSTLKEAMGQGGYTPLIKAIQNTFNMSKYEAIGVADNIFSQLGSFNNSARAQGFDLMEELNKVNPNGAQSIYQDIMNNGQKWFQEDWRNLMTDVSKATGSTGEQAFRETMKVKAILDKLYENIPEDMKPYFVGTIDKERMVGQPSGLDMDNMNNMGYMYNYKGAPIFHPINSGSNFNESAKNMDNIREIMKHVDGIKAGETSPQLLDKFMIDPSSNWDSNTVGSSAIQSGLVWLNPEVMSDTYNLRDTIYHEIAHQVQRTVSEGNTNKFYNEERFTHYINEVLTRDSEYLMNMGEDGYANLINGSGLNNVDKAKFMSAIGHIEEDNVVSKYAFDSMMEGRSTGLKESVAEDAMLYMAHPELYEKLLPNRSAYLNALFTEASKDLLPVDEIVKLTAGKSSKIASQYQAGVKYIDNEINKVMSQLDQAKKDIEDLTIDQRGGKQAYKDIKKGLVNVFEKSNAKEQDFLKQVEIIFKGTSLQDRKSIMNYLSQGVEVPENLRPQAEAFIKWRESVIKEYNNLGIPAKALENYVPFIPIRELSHAESKMLNVFFGTGNTKTLDNVNDWLFDIDPNLQSRTTQAISPSEVNRVLGKEWLTEDAAMAMAIRGTRAIKAQESVTFMKGVLDKYGLTMEDIAANNHKVPKGYKFYSSKIEGTGKPILTELKEMTANVEGFALPEEFAKVFNEYTSMLHDPQASNAFLKLYDKATSWYKKVAYLWNPGHIPRDTVSNMFNGWLMGNNSIKSYMDAGQVLANHLVGKHDATVKFAGKEITSQRMWEIATDYGMIDVGAALSETPMEVTKHLNGRKFSYSGAMRSASRANDAWTRVANFMFLVNEKGMKPAEAAAQVKKFLFDYFDLTPFERKVMRRVIPFYSWMRKNMPLQVEQLFTNTQKYSKLEKVLRNIQGEEWNPEDNPDFINESGAIRLPGKEGERIFAAPNLPYTDLARLPLNMNSFGNLLASINPLIRAPFIELPTNTQLFSGREIEKYPGEQQELPFAAIIEKLMGADVPEVDKRGLGYGINQIPILRNLDAISNPDNPRQMPKISSFIGGPNYYTEDQVKKSAAYQERDRLRDAIQSLQDQGVEVPTIKDLRQQDTKGKRRSLVDKYSGGN